MLTNQSLTARLGSQVFDHHFENPLKGGDVSLDGNLDLNVSVDGGGTVALIVVSVLAAVVVILLIVFFSCKRGCKCCDNLCCKGRCHTTEAEKAVIEQNKKLQDDLRKMNHNLQTLQVVF